MPADDDSRIREEFSLLYGCSTDFFNSPGTFIRPQDSLAGKNKVYLTRYRDWSVLTVSPGDAGMLEGRLKASRVFGPDNFTDFWKSGRLAETLHGLILPPDAAPAGEVCEGYTLQEHDPSNHPLLEQFLEQCSPEEIDDADIDLDDPDDAIVLVMKDGEPVAYSGYRVLRKNLGDMGILVLPGHRRKGLAVASLARCIEICRRRGYIPLYRHWETNRNSGSTAARLGFRREYAVEVYDIES